MGKVKSAICLFLMSLVIAVMCFFCTVSFEYQGGLKQFNSVIRMTDKDASFGTEIGESGYLGGGYSSVYYPEGVISSKEYEENMAVYGDEEAEEYSAKYVKSGAVYLEKETVCGGGEAPTEEFKADFDKVFSDIKARYEALHVDGARVDIADGYTVRIMMPQLMAGGISLFRLMSYTGPVTVAYGSDADSANTILPANKKDAVIGDYIKGFSSRVGADGTAYVIISFTKAGREIVKNTTSDAGENSSTMFFKIGDNTTINLSVSSSIDQDKMYISGSYTRETANATAVLLDNALNGSQSEMAFTVGDTYRETASFGDNALMLLYIAYGVCFVGMTVFFFVRYKKLAFAHLLTYLLFFFSLMFCVWAIEFLYIGVGTALGVMLASVLLSVSNVIVYEKARKEYANGRTITAAVKSAYKQTFWHIFDLHIVIAALSFIVFGIALPGLSTFAFTLGLGTAFSFLCNIAIGRLNWACTMAFTPRKGAFCNFKREETEDE